MPDPRIKIEFGPVTIDVLQVLAHCSVGMLNTDSQSRDKLVGQTFGRDNASNLRKMADYVDRCIDQNAKEVRN